MDEPEAMDLQLPHWDAPRAVLVLKKLTGGEAYIRVVETKEERWIQASWLQLTGEGNELAD